MLRFSSVKLLSITKQLYVSKMAVDLVYNNKLMGTDRHCRPHSNFEPNIFGQKAKMMERIDPCVLVQGPAWGMRSSMANGC